MMRATSAGLGIGLATMLATIGSGYAAYLPTLDVETAKSEMAPRDIAAESELYCVALAVYFEGGSTFESEDGMRHIARVVVQRAHTNLRKWGGANLCDVVFYKRAGVCQFSFACLPVARRIPRFGSLWQQSVAIAQDEVEGKSSVAEESIRYYMNPALTSDRNACRFRKEFIPVVDAGRHAFFREPTEVERAELMKSQPAECLRYKAALEARARAAKALAEKKKRLAAAALAKKKHLAAVKKKAKLRYAGK